MTKLFKPKKEVVVDIKFNKPPDSDIPEDGSKQLWEAGQFWYIKAEEAAKLILEWFPKNVKVNKIDHYGPPGSFDILVHCPTGGERLVHNHLHLNHGFLKGLSDDARQDFVKKAINDVVQGQEPEGVEEELKDAVLKHEEETSKKLWAEQEAAEEAKRKAIEDEEAQKKAAIAAEHEAKAQAKAKAKAEAKAKAQAKAKAKAKARAEADAKAKAEADAKAEEDAKIAEAEEKAQLKERLAKAEAELAAKAEEEARQAEAARIEAEQKAEEERLAAEAAAAQQVTEVVVPKDYAHDKLNGDIQKQAIAPPFSWLFCCRSSSNEPDVQGDLPQKFVS